MDDEVINDPNALDALRGCGLLKFFKMPNMKANTRFLDMFIHYWSIEDDSFMIDQMQLEIKVEDIYFITGLSSRGEVVHSTSRARGSLSIEDYVHIYCSGHPERVGRQIPIKHVEILSLRIINFHHS